MARSIPSHQVGYLHLCFSPCCLIVFVFFPSLVGINFNHTVCLCVVLTTVCTVCVCVCVCVCVRVCVFVPPLSVLCPYADGIVPFLLHNLPDFRGLCRSEKKSFYFTKHLHLPQ